MPTVLPFTCLSFSCQALLVLNNSDVVPSKSTSKTSAINRPICDLEKCSPSDQPVRSTAAQTETTQQTSVLSTLPFSFFSLYPETYKPTSAPE